MSEMDKRGEAFKNKFAHDAELQFKAEARRNKLLGQWAAEKLGKSGSELEDYAKEVVRSDFEEPGEEDVFRKVREDLDKAGISKSDDEIRAVMSELLATAVGQIQNET